MYRLVNINTFNIPILSGIKKLNINEFNNMEYLSKLKNLKHLSTLSNGKIKNENIKPNSFMFVKLFKLTI